MKRLFYKRPIIFFTLCFLVPLQGFAATFFFESDHSMFSLGDQFIVEVYLDTENSKVNTISGEIAVDTDSILVTDMIDGNSSILFWVEKPNFDESKSSITFSGITPGGVSGERLFLFSIKSSVISSPGYASFSTKNEIVLRHDGDGTEESISFIPKTIYSSNDDSIKQTIALPLDAEAPEDFTPTITSNENLYDGKKVIVFSSQDKSSGISYYLVKEGYFGRFVVAESPYVLRDQKLFKTFFVKAVDKAGNERLAIVNPQEKIIDENFILISSILIVVLIISIVYYRKKYS